MAEYVHPGVYVEDISSPPLIEGAPTATALFVLPGDGQPAGVPSAVLRGAYDLAAAIVPPHAGLTAAANVFFANGGERLHAVFAGSGAWEAALAATVHLDEVALVAAPGCPEAAPALIAHAEATGRFAIVDPPAGLDLTAISAFRARFDTRAGALYYPWIVTASGVQPPAAFAAGIYARVDAKRGVHKAPANEAVNGATGLAAPIDAAQQDVLNPLGINCLRVFPGKGVTVFGARTMSSDPERKYVPVSRQLRYLERSLRRGLAWAVFEPNAPPLWARVRRAADRFLYDEWRRGAFQGVKRDEAWFVRCDETTMTQNDLDNGRLVVLIGIAPLKPAEFVIFRVGLTIASAP